jgi:hypothetical protein
MLSSNVRNVRRSWVACSIALLVGAGAAVGGGGACSRTGTDVDETEGGAGDAAKDSGSLKPCGKNGVACPGNEWCSFDPPGTCGAGPDGLCKSRPATCPTSCPGVCGCNGQVYCNPCEASRAGTDVAGNTACLPAGGVYTAYDLFTNISRIVVFKADPQRDICVRVTLAQSNSGSGGRYLVEMPLGWAVERAQITDHAADCSITTGGAPPTPAGNVLEAAGAQGKIEFIGDAGTDPCSLFIHASLAFDAGAFKGAPAAELLDVDNLKVAGACP